MGSIQPSNINIPVIDISSKNPDAPQQLLDAAARYGFLFIENNEAGIPVKDVGHMFDLSREFFASPLDVKEEVSISSNAAGANHGWLSRGVEKLDPATQKSPDIKEALNIGAPINGHLQQPMPKPLQPHIQTIMDFQNSCHQLCQTINKHFAIALGLDEDWFISRHDMTKGPSGTIFRMLYYPHVDDAEDIDLRAGAHSDFGSITLLFQQRGQPGLEIKTPEGEWAAVPVDPVSEANGDVNVHRDSSDRPLPILVNIGDLLEDWTGGLLKSTVHRVIFPEGGPKEDRYSMAYFLQPLDDADLIPVPSKLVHDHTTRTGKSGARNGRTLTAKGHLMERLAATYTLK